MRSLLAAVAVVAAAGLGALILGEYELAGATPFVAGALFGLLLAELAVTVAGRSSVRDSGRSLVLTAVAAPAGAGAMVWAAWISSGRDWDFVPTEAWAGVVLAATAAAAWIRGSRRRATGSPPAPR